MLRVFALWADYCSNRTAEYKGRMKLGTTIGMYLCLPNVLSLSGRLPGSVPGILIHSVAREGAFFNSMQ